jgi:putative salt-induced outer membrane protein YdiY
MQFRAGGLMKYSTLVVVPVFLVAATTLGQTPVPEAEVTAKPWSGEAAVSFVQTTGNTQNQTLGAGLKAAWQNAPWKVSFAAAYLRAKAADVETARKTNAALRGDYDLTARIGVYAQESYMKDRFAGIESQWISEAGGTYKLLLGPVHALSASAGLAYTSENRLPPDSDRRFLGGIAGISYKWKISSSAEFGEDAVFLQSFKASRDWRFNNAASLSVSMTKVLAVKLTHQLSYLHLPATGKTRTDTTFLASLVAKL